MRRYLFLLPVLLTAVVILLVIGFALLPRLPRTAPPTPDPTIIQAMKKQCDIADWYPITLNHQPYWGVGNLDLDPYNDGSVPGSDGLDEGGSLSPDGGRLLMFLNVINPTLIRIEITDLATKQTSEMVQQYHLDANPADQPWQVIQTAFWDPADPRYIFTNRYRLYTASSMKQRVLRSRTEYLGQPTPDGKWLTVLSSGEAKDTYLRSRVNPRIKKMVAWPRGYVTISPDGSIVQGTVNYCQLVIFNTKTQQMKPLKTLFWRNSSMTAKGTKSVLCGVPHWLPDSSGFVVNGTEATGTGGSYTYGKTGIWKMSASGQVTFLLAKATIIASSDNGLHWLFRSDDKYYMAHCK